MTSIKKFLSNLYPTTKLLVMLVVTIYTLLTPGYINQYLTFGLVTIFALISGVVKDYLSIFFKSIFFIVLFIFIMQCLLIPGETIIWQQSFIKISQEGIDNSLLMTSKIMAISSLIILFFRVTTIKDLIYSLEKLGLNRKATFVVLSTLQLIPQMKGLMNTIMQAQQSRGIEVEGNLMVRIKAILPMISPLVLSSIQETEERVLTLESRAFSAKVKKTNVYEVKKTISDTIVRLLALVLFVLIFIWR